jgi:long-chain acyl-CoA synthetase
MNMPTSRVAARQWTASTGALGDPLEAATVCEAFQRVVSLHGDRPALRTLDRTVDLTWAQLGRRVERIAAGLAAHGVEHGDTVAMLLPNSVECHIIDFAALHLGAVPFTIYNSSSPEQIVHQLDNADARMVVTNQGLFPKIEQARAALSRLELVVVGGDAGDLTFDALEAEGSPNFDFEASWQAVEPGDLVTLIYTSGTTGPPKGVEWAHRTVMAQLRALDAALPLPREALVSFLPMAHAGGRLTCHYLALPYGASITTCPDMRELPSHIAKVHPDALFAVPRLWEKFQVAVEAAVEGLDGDKRAAARAAVASGLEVVRAEDAATWSTGADAIPSAAEQQTRLTALRPVLARLGLDRIKAAFVGGAPCAPEVVQFFRAVGVLLEAYGLTEGCLNVFNRVEEFKTGTAGRPLPGVELRLAADGEILVRGALSFVGYRKEPDATAEALDVDGWLHTGDIAEVDDLGFVKIIDRKKEIMINAAGKNMSPANIEAAIRGESSLIGQVVAIGDGRRYNTALVTLDPEAAALHVKRLGLDADAFGQLVKVPEIRAEVERAVQRGNERLSGVEQIKKFALLGVAWAPDSEELTPTLKLKRKAIAAKYATRIAELYDDSQQVRGDQDVGRGRGACGRDADLA